MMRIAVVLGCAAGVAGAVLTWLLLPEPFGRAFDFSLLLATLGFVTVLVILGLYMLRARPVWVRVTATLPLLFAALVTSVAVVVAVDHRCLFFRGLPPNPTAEEWQEDLDYLAEQMAAVHPGLYSLVPREYFDGVVAEVRSAISAMSEEQILMELFRIIALPNDAHTYPFVFYPVYDLHLYPIQAYWFDDGLYVVRAARGYRETVGSRILAAAGVPIEDLYQAFTPYLAAENEFGRLDRWSGLPMAEWLEAEGLSQDGSAVIELERADGERYEVGLRPVALAPFGYWSVVRQIERETSPAVSNDRREAYWFEYYPDAGVVHFQFNHSLDEWNGVTLESVLTELDSLLDTVPLDRFVLDLRNSGGGNLRPAVDVAEFIAGDPRIDQRGRLLVLIGRRTFSAGASLAAMLRYSSSAVFMGEPTGQGPVYYAGPRLVTLPNSRLPVAISTRLSAATVFTDPPDWIEPDVWVSYTHGDFLNGRDPILEAALEYEAPPLTEAEVEPAVLARHIGRYRWSPHQALTVTFDGDRLHLAVEDFMEGGSARLRTVLYAVSTHEFTTAVPGVTVSFARGRENSPAVTVEWAEGGRNALRLEAGYVYPLELLRDGAADEAVTAVLVDSSVYRSVPGFEAEMNGLGYRYLRDDRTAEAVAVFKLNVALFPESSNTYDSLGEGYMEHGDTGLAVENYRRSLELDPENDNAKEILRRMGADE